MLAIKLLSVQTVITDKSDHLLDNVDPCSLYMFGRLNSDCEDDYPHHTSHENTRRSGIPNYTRDIPQHQYNSSSLE